MLRMKERFLGSLELGAIEKALQVCGGISEYPIKLACREDVEGTIVNKIGKIWGIPSEISQTDCY